MLYRKSFCVAVCVGLTLLQGLTAWAQTPQTTTTAALYPQTVIRDTPFWQDYRELFPLATPAENDVRGLTVDSKGRVWAATAAGIRYLDGKTWKTPKGGDLNGPAFVVTTDASGEAWAGAWDGLYRLSPESVVRGGLEGKAIGALTHPAGSKETLFAAGPDGVWRFEGEKWTPLKGRWVAGVRALETDGPETLWIGTISGLYRLNIASVIPTSTERFGKPDTLLSSYIYSLRRAANGDLYIGSTGGIDVYRGAIRLRSFTGKEGLPQHNARALAFDSDNRLWVATALGVARYDANAAPTGERNSQTPHPGVPNGWSFRHSRRWVPADEIRDVAIDREGTCWVATNAGVAAIKRKRMTLEEKADYMLDVLRKYQIRPPGIVGPANLETPGDLSKFSVGDTDNDGSLTAYHCVAESYRYAVTKDPKARANAKEAFRALEFFQIVTGTKHFFARTVIPIDAPPLNDLNHTHTPQEIAETHLTEPRYKPVDVRWRKSADGKWLWKGDTSSDEMDGHLFAYGAYYDLAADAEDKKRCAALVDRIVGGIIDNGFILKDTDGTATRWAVWSPEKLNGDENWREERSGNSLEMLAYLTLAHHVTGKKRYLDTKKNLIEKHGYAKNAIMTEYDTPSERTYITDSLLPMVYPNLMEHETDPALIAVFRSSLRFYHSTVKRDGRGHYDFFYNRYSGDSVSLNAAIDDLREWPLDLIDYTVDNSKRDDVEFSHVPGADENQLTRRLPASERGLTETDGSPYSAVRGNEGKRLHTSFIWLLDYWQARYWNLLR